MKTLYDSVKKVVLQVVVGIQLSSIKTISIDLLYEDISNIYIYIDGI